MASTKQRAANRANALKSTGPRTSEGKRSASINALQHGLSLPVDERLFAKEIDAVYRLVRPECSSDAQAREIAKRIIDFERNEFFLLQPTVEEAKQEVEKWGLDASRLALIHLSQAHRNKQPVGFTFTTPNHSPKGKERTKEISFLEGALRLFDQVALGKVRAAERQKISSERYQKRAINQLVKGIHAVARGEEL